MNGAEDETVRGLKFLLNTWPELLGGFAAFWVHHVYHGIWERIIRRVTRKPKH